MATTTTEKSTVNLFDMMVDQGVQNLKTFAWMQEQGEKVARSYMEHNATVREETLKVAGRMADHFKQANRQWVEVAQNAVQTTVEAYRAPQAAFFDRMAKATAKSN